MGTEKADHRRQRPRRPAKPWPLAREQRAWIECRTRVGWQLDAAQRPRADRGRSIVCQTAAVICMTILYPKTDNATFDMDYYTSTHMPMLAKAMGDGCQGWGAASVSTDQHVAMGWIVIDSMDTYDAGMAAHGAEIRADVANYTNQQPEIIMGEVTGGSN